MTTPVIFRMWKGQVIALFPDTRADPAGNCESYMRIGQHGAADYAGLLTELISIGYDDLKIYHRRPPRK